MIFRIKIISSLLFSIVLHFSLLGQDTISAHDGNGQKHMLWKVSSGGEIQGYLMGSMHSVKPGFYPIDEIYHEVFRKSNPIIFEVDLGKSKGINMSIISMAFYTNGENLKDNIPKGLYKKTKQKAEKLGLAKYNYFKPWFAALIIAREESKNENNATADGVDEVFYEKAKQAGKTIIALETAKEALGFFNKLEKDLQVKFLKNVVTEENKGEQENYNLVKYWKTGNVKAAQSIKNTKAFNSGGKLTKKIKQKLIFERNKKWFGKIEKFLKKDKTPLIIVGLWHLIGNHNLIKKLRKVGYTVEQI